MDDWRANISDIDTLNDLDPHELMIYLRHMFLSSAKDLIKSSHPGDRSFAEQCCETAEKINDAIIAFYTDKC